MYFGAPEKAGWEMKTVGATLGVQEACLVGLLTSKPPRVKHSSARTRAFNIRGLVEMAAPAQAQQAEVRARGRQTGGPPSSRRERMNRVLGANTPSVTLLVPDSSGVWVVLVLKESGVLSQVAPTMPSN